MKKFSLFCWGLLLWCCLLAGAAHASNWSPATLSALGQIPVLQDGRLKPLLSAARALHHQITDEAAGYHSLPWLLDIILEPAGKVSRPLIKIYDQQTLALLGLSPRQGRRYSVQELTPALQNLRSTLQELSALPNSQLSPSQRALLEVANRVSLFDQVAQTFSMLQPLALPLERVSPPNFLAWQKERSNLLAEAKAIAARLGADLSRYDSEALAVVQTSLRLEQLQVMGQFNESLRLLPPQWEVAAAVWQTPWQYVLGGGGSPAAAAYLRQWEALIMAAQADDDAALSTHAQTLQTTAESLTNNHIASWRLQLEYYFYALDPFYLSFTAYALVGLLLLSMGFFPRMSWFWPTLLLAGAGLAAHGLGLLVRMVLLARPPVSSIYESVLFVGLLVALAGIGLALLRRQAAPLWLVAGPAALLQLVGLFFGSEGDTLGTLQAVLNTNFWLATHVVCITLGYGACLVTAGVAHYALWQPNGAARLLRPLTLLALLSLTLVAVGTLLGGVWADQSWGRFWGWDPKENGALLITLWLIWALHARIAGQFNARWFALAMATLSLVVALAWFGVNFLGVGLHSYGFIEEGAMALAAYVAVQLLVLAGLAWRSHTIEPAHG